MKNYNRQIGAWLAYQRKAHNMSQDDVADAMHVTKAAVSRWETGIRTIDAGKMFEFCNVINADIRQMVTDIENGFGEE
jgi:transcriptional regulator with XRE-family HTH domain